MNPVDENGHERPCCSRCGCEHRCGTVQVENEKLRGLLSEAMYWLGDASAYNGTDAADDFIERALAVFAEDPPR